MGTVTAKEETFRGHGDMQLFARSWRPPGLARSVVIVVHGFKSHVGMYDRVAHELVSHGLAVWAFDLRGHGRSGGERYWVDEISDYVDDLAAFVELVRSRELDQPIFLLGHSAGGVIAALYALDHQSELTGFVCESFAFEVPPPEFALEILKGLALVAPRAPILALNDSDFSRDPAVVARMKDDPLINHAPGPAHTLAELIRGHDRLAREFGRIRLSLLVLHGTADRATKPHGSQRFYDEAGSRDKTLDLYEGHYHDLLNDVGWEEVLGDIVSWLERRIPTR